MYNVYMYIVYCDCVLCTVYEVLCTVYCVLYTVQLYSGGNEVFCQVVRSLQLRLYIIITSLPALFETLACI